MLNKNLLDIPRLPIPTLYQTMNKYLNSVQPLTNSTIEFTSHSLVALDFQNTVGPKLQQIIENQDLANQNQNIYPHNYMESQWDDMYMGGRWSLPINSNPFYLLKYLSSLPSLTSSLLKFGAQIKANKFPPCDPRSRGCMRSFPFMIGTGRKATLDRDVLSRYLLTSTHIAVFCRNVIYKVEAIDPLSHLVRSPAYFENVFDEISNNGKHVPDNDFVGVALTGVNRDDAANNRATVVGASASNEQSLLDVDSALFVVCLDEAADITLNNESEVSERAKYCVQVLWKECEATNPLLTHSRADALARKERDEPLVRQALAH